MCSIINSTREQEQQQAVQVVLLLSGMSVLLAVLLSVSGDVRG